MNADELADEVESTAVKGATWNTLVIPAEPSFGDHDDDERFVAELIAAMCRPIDKAAPSCFWP